ncbi:MAG: hypothetical protein H8E36_07425 [Rhodospirillaceae bacterium]|nr:hypothetical protein [Rhodospirillaceae bacterium]
MPTSRKTQKQPSKIWYNPIDLTPELAERLVNGLAKNHRHRLELLVRKGGRASMVALLGITQDDDLRILSYFQGALSRKIRRLVGDREKRLHLIGWDYASTEWDAEHTKIVNGDCYISDQTVVALSKALGVKIDNDVPPNDLRRRDW